MLAGGIARAETLPSTVQVPLTIDYITLGEALKRQLYTDNGRAPLWNGANACQYFYADHPMLSRKGGQMGLETGASLSIGVPMGSQCLSPIRWDGIIAATTAPYVSGKSLKLRVTDIDLLDEHHNKTMLVGRGFDLVKNYFIPRIETFEFDLAPAADRLRDLAGAAAPPTVAERVKTALASLRVRPEIAPLDDGIRATIELTLPYFPTAAPAATPPPLSAEELAAFEKLVDQWDAFMVFAIKQLAGTYVDRQFRQDLLDLLLDSRRRLIDALAHPDSGGPDPVRVLFVDKWKRLGEILRGAARRGALGDRSLEFLSFISAGDAMFALDQAAPALGMRISADDMRRLAHLMAPQAQGDPLAFSFDEDPELAKLLGVKKPLASEGAFEPGPTEAPAAPTTAAPGATATPAASVAGPAPPSPPPAAGPTAAPAIPATPNPADKGPSSMLELFDWTSRAHAADVVQGGIDLTRRLQDIARKLGRAVARDDNADRYRTNMEGLLEMAGRREMSQENLDSSYRAVYARLVKAAAWQESCWRQFHQKGNRIVYLESSTHDVGLMQVNKFVWRGFYSVPRLEWDLLYNASAGMEILAQLLDDIQGKRGAMSAGKPDELARSTYAAYNGGPGAYRRWRGREAEDERLVDDSFWTKYQAVSRGQKIDIMSCAATWGQAPGH